ncbi:MAG TPA: hypothetical protein VM409_08675 [Chloroflexia bacterium]|nr:hypothetical protein [Chloroflexia bacterium]
MEKRTVRGFYDDGIVRILDPLHVEGCWNLEITFTEQVEDEDGLLEANPHGSRELPNAIRLEELHRQIEDSRPPIGPI